MNYSFFLNLNLLLCVCNDLIIIIIEQFLQLVNYYYYHYYQVITLYYQILILLLDYGCPLFLFYQVIMPTCHHHYYGLDIIAHLFCSVRSLYLHLEDITLFVIMIDYRWKIVTLKTKK